MNLKELANAIEDGNLQNFEEQNDAFNKYANEYKERVNLDLEKKDDA